MDWVSVKASWGTSFQAPTPVAELGSLHNTIIAVQFPLAPPGVTFPAGDYLLYESGSTPNLRPQTAATHSFGLELAPPFIPGFTTNADYYYISYKGIIGAPPITGSSAPIFFANYPQDYVLNPTPAQQIAFANQKGSQGGQAALAQVGGPYSGKVFELIYFLYSNQGDARQAGLDWSAFYTHDTDFGSIDGRISANYVIENFANAGPGTAFRNLLHPGASDLRFSATVGANVGDHLRAQVTWNHTQGYDITPITALVPDPSNPSGPPITKVLQNHVDSFNVFNLFFNYDLSGAGICGNMDAESVCENAAISLNVNNVLDQAPPVYKVTWGLGASPGYANGATLGRVFEIGLSKKF